MTQSGTVRRTGWLAALVVVLAAAGCGGEREPAVPAAPAVDPRFASADALLDYYNEQTVNRPAIEPLAVLDLMYAENETQERLLRIVRNSIPILEFEQALWDLFGEGLESKNVPPLAPNLRPTFITQRSDQRAQGREFNADGTETDLYLVLIGERWWLSAYTFEYRPDFVQKRDQLDQYDQLIERASNVAPGITRRVRAHEFATVAEARQAFNLALALNSIDAGTRRRP